MSYNKISSNFNPKIYSLSSSNSNLMYIGSTCLPPTIRFRNHLELYKQHLKGNNKKCTAFQLFELGGIITMAILDDCSDVCCKKSLLKRERFYIENNNCVNKNIPSRTIQESNKAYYEKNKEKKKQYYLDNKEIKLQYAKDYINANKEKYNEYQKQYRIKMRLLKESNN